MVFLVIFLPFFSFLIISLFGFIIGKKWVCIVAFLNSFLTLLLSIYFFYFTILGKTFFITFCYWFNLSFLKVYWSLTIDLTTSVMLFTVSFISFLVILYSFEYMNNDPFFFKFISLLSIFTFFMLLFVASDNFLQFFLGWEGIGLCSYLLINFWSSRIQAVKSSFKAIIVNRVGDVALLAAFSLFFFISGTLDFSILNVLIPFLQYDYIYILNIKINILYLIGFFLLIGIMAKSAQIGLHIWLPDAMEGPTPVSALIHAATMVTAGIYLLIRLSVVFEFLPKLLCLISFIGAFTAFFSATVALVQTDIKKIIAYSTCSQLGYMLFSCGVSFYSLSLFHLFNHAFFKALLFLSAGSIIHSLNNEQDIRKMGGMLKILPNSYISLLIASLSLCGFPFLSGYYSKDLIIESALLNLSINNMFCFWLIYITAFLTVFYSIRLIFLVFYNKFNYFKSNFFNIHESGIHIYISLLILIFFSIFSGYFFKEIFIGFGSFFFETNLLELPKIISFFEIECFNELFFFYNLHYFYLILLKFLPIYLVFFSIFVYYFYTFFFYKILYNFFFNKILVFKFNLKGFYLNCYFKLIFFLSNKWYIDYFYNLFIIRFFLINNLNIFLNYFDKGLIEWLGPSVLSLNILKYSRFFNKIKLDFINNFFFLLFFFFIFFFFCFFF